MKSIKKALIITIIIISVGLTIFYFSKINCRGSKNIDIKEIISDTIKTDSIIKNDEQR